MPQHSTSSSVLSDAACGFCNGYGASCIMSDNLVNALDAAAIITLITMHNNEDYKIEFVKGAAMGFVLGDTCRRLLCGYHRQQIENPVLNDNHSDPDNDKTQFRALITPEPETQTSVQSDVVGYGSVNNATHTTPLYPPINEHQPLYPKIDE